jgi:hypothetical protein
VKASLKGSSASAKRGAVDLAPLELVPERKESLRFLAELLSKGSGIATAVDELLEVSVEVAPADLDSAARPGRGVVGS